MNAKNTNDLNNKQPYLENLNFVFVSDFDIRASDLNGWNIWAIITHPQLKLAAPAAALDSGFWLLTLSGMAYPASRPRPFIGEP